MASREQLSYKILCSSPFHCELRSAYCVENSGLATFVAGAVVVVVDGVGVWNNAPAERRLDPLDVPAVEGVEVPPPNKAFQLNAIPSLACLVLLAPKRLPRKNVDFHLRFELKPRKQEGRAACSLSLACFLAILSSHERSPRRERMQAPTFPVPCASVEIEFSWLG